MKFKLKNSTDAIKKLRIETIKIPEKSLTSEEIETKGKYLVKLYTKRVLEKININMFWATLSRNKAAVKEPKQVTDKATWILDLT